MNGIKVSQLPEASSIENDDLIMIVQDGSNKKIPASSTTLKISAGDNIDITNNEISATYTAGTGIDITGGVISNTQTSTEWGDIEGTLSNQTDLQTELNSKQDTLVSGTNIKTINSESIVGNGNISIIGTTVNDNYNTTTNEAYSCNYVNNAVLEVYSTTEQVIGTWIDGKPLYRRVIETTVQSNSFTLLSNSSNIKNIIQYNGFVIRSDNNIQFTFPEGQFGFPGIYIPANSSQLIFNCNTTEYPVGSSLKVVLVYTKTTD